MEVRNSTPSTAVHPMGTPASQPVSTTKATSKASKATSTKVPTKATSKASKATSTKVPTKVDAKGNALRCTVIMGTKQCQNPARWPHGKGHTCTTHHKAILAGSQYAKHALLRAPVNAALWGAKVPTSKVASK